MNCELCGKAVATVHLTVIVQENMNKIDLCEACAKEYGVQDPTGFPHVKLIQTVEAMRRGKKPD